MNQIQLSLRLKKLTQQRESIQEAVKLVELSRELFQKKLDAIRERNEKETDIKKRGKLIKEIVSLTRQFKQSMRVIETYMDMVEKGVIE